MKTEVLLPAAVENFGGNSGLVDFFIELRHENRNILAFHTIFVIAE